MDVKHYGGKDNPFEVIKFINHWNMNFNLGNVVKYVARAGRKTLDPLPDLLKARDYIEFEIERITQSKSRLELMQECSEEVK